MKKKILVTGGAGFIGSHIVDGLIERGHDVRVLDSLDPQVHANADGPPKYLNEKAEFIRGDIRNKDDVKKALADIEVLYHEAAAVGVGQSMYMIDHYVDVNSRGAGMVLDQIFNGKNSIEKMIVASSMSIYGEGMYLCENCGEFEGEFRGRKQLEARRWEMTCPGCGKPAQPIATPETKPLAPTSVYAIGKRDHEELFMSLGKAYGMPTVALRYFNVYGPRQSLSNPYTGVAAIFQSNIKNDNPPIIYEDGGQSRDFVDYRDVVSANMLALESSKADYGIFNVGAGKPVSVLDIAKTFARLYGKSVEPKIQQKFRQGDIRHCFADISRIRDIGYEPKIGFDRGMSDLVEWGMCENALDLSQKALAELRQRDLVER